MVKIMPWVDQCGCGKYKRIEGIAVEGSLIGRCERCRGWYDVSVQDELVMAERELINATKSLKLARMALVVAWVALGVAVVSGVMR